MIHLTFLKKKKTAALLLACMLGFSSAGCAKQDSAANGQDSAAASHAQGSLSHKGYTLEQVVVLSRHNIRSPLSGGDSLLGQVTPHTWHTGSGWSRRVFFLQIISRMRTLCGSIPTPSSAQSRLHAIFPPDCFRQPILRSNITWNMTKWIRSLHRSSPF